MKARIVPVIIAALIAAGIVGVGTPAQAHRVCYTTTSTTLGGSNRYCDGSVSCDWVKAYHWVRHWYGYRYESYWKWSCW
jgi:hypothetical protein